MNDAIVTLFNFRCWWRGYNFEHGIAKDKTVILKALGSNFLMKNGKLHIDLQKPFIEFNNNHVLVNAELKTIEPSELVAVGANNKVFEDWFFKWSTLADVV